MNYLLVTWLLVLALLAPTASSAKSFCIRALENTSQVQILNRFNEGPVLRFTGASGESRNPENVTIATFNVKHLFTGNDSVSREMGRMVPLGNGNSMGPLHIQGKADAINDMGAELVMLQEVGNINDLQRFAREALNDEYHAFLLETNVRGNEVAFLIKKSFDFNFDIHSFRNLRTADGRNTFTRDAQVIVVKDPESGRPLFAVLNTHLKSQRRSRNRNISTEQRRTEEAQGMLDVMARVRQRVGNNDLPFAFTGDMNNDLREVEFSSIRDAGFHSSFLDSRTPVNDPTTFVYFPGRSRPKHNQLDYILLDPNLRARGALEESDVYRYRDDEGVEIELPQRARDKSDLPSDHYPVWARFNFERLIQ